MSKHSKASEALKTKPKKSSGRGISRGITKEKIVTLACEMIGKNGIDNFRIRDVAEKLGVMPPAIYNHFPNRESVLIAVSEKVSHEMLNAAHSSHEKTALGKIRFFLNGFTEYLYNNPTAAQLQLVDIASQVFLGLGETEELNERTRQDIKITLEQGVKEGVFRQVRPEAFRAFVIGGISASVIWHNYDKMKKRPSLKQLQKEVDEIALRFLLSDPDTIFQ